jgi:hypothetical protein
MTHSFPWHGVRPDEIPSDDVMVQMFVYTSQKIQTTGERIKHDVHYWTVLLLQRYGLVPVNMCNLEF